jgi:hypothetical protein
LNQERRHSKEVKKTSMEIIGLKHSMPAVVVSAVVETSVVGSTVVGSAVVGSTVVGVAVVGSAVVGAAVVGSAVVGAIIVGAAVVGAGVVGTDIVGAGVVGADVGAGVVAHSEFCSIQSTYVFTFAYTPGRSGLAQPIPQDTTPASLPLQIKGPPLSP